MTISVMISQLNVDRKLRRVKVILAGGRVLVVTPVAGRFESPCKWCGAKNDAEANAKCNGKCLE